MPYTPNKTTYKLPIVEVAVEIRTHNHHEYENGYLSPIQTKLIFIKLLRTNYTSETIWIALNQAGFYQGLWFIQSYWIAQEYDWCCFGIPIAEHEDFPYTIYSQDEQYLLLNTTNLMVLATSQDYDVLPKKAGLSIFNFVKL